MANSARRPARKVESVMQQTSAESSKGKTTRELDGGSESRESFDEVTSNKRKGTEAGATT